MSPLFKWTVDLDALTDEAYAFVTDPRPTRNQRSIVTELSDVYPEAIDVLESMLIDGTEERADVAAYIDAVFGSGLQAPAR